MTTAQKLAERHTEAVVQSVLRIGLDGKAYVAYQAVADGYGIVAEGSRGFAEQAALAFNA